MIDQLSRSELSKITGVCESEVNLSLDSAPVWVKLDGHKGVFVSVPVLSIHKNQGRVCGSVFLTIGDKLFSGAVLYDEAQSVWILVTLDPHKNESVKQVEAE